MKEGSTDKHSTISREKVKDRSNKQMVPKNIYHIAGFFSYILEGAESRLPIPDGRLDANRSQRLFIQLIYIWLDTNELQDRSYC